MASPRTAPDPTGFTPEQERVLSKILWRIVLFLLFCYIFAYLDRLNVGVAGLTINRDLGLSPSQFGWSAGLFFVSIGNPGSFAWALIALAACPMPGAMLIRCAGMSLRDASTAPQASLKEVES